MDSYTLLHSWVLQAPTLKNLTSWTPIDCSCDESYRLLRWETHTVDSYRLLHRWLLQAPTLRNLTWWTRTDCYIVQYYRLLCWKILRRGLLYIAPLLTTTGSYVEKSHIVDSCRLLHGCILLVPTLRNPTPWTPIDFCMLNPKTPMLRNITLWTPMKMATQLSATVYYAERSHTVDSDRFPHSWILQAPTLRHPTLWTPIHCNTVGCYWFLR